MYTTLCLYIFELVGISVDVYAFQGSCNLGFDARTIYNRTKDVVPLNGTQLNAENASLRQWFPTFWVLSPGVMFCVYFWSRVTSKL